MLKEFGVSLQIDGSLLFRIKPGTPASSRPETRSPTSAGVGVGACVYPSRRDGVRMLIETTCMRPASRLRWLARSGGQLDEERESPLPHSEPQESLEHRRDPEPVVG